ncbi:hypothetical protein [Thalassoglobus neptunius]|nr:hypothetical protein [Thalassoglobus neptunius]
MITFSSKSLPFSQDVFIAFRIAILETEERLSLAHQIDLADHSGFGYLTQVPFLKSVPPQVQIDLLLTFWDRYLARERFASDYLDESIVYAVCETAATLVRSQPTVASRFIETGPLNCPFTPTGESADRLQKLHLDYVSNGHFLLLSQFQDLPPDEARELKREYGINSDSSERMFDVLSQWHVSTDVESRAIGLLTESESARMSQVLATSMGLRKVSE